MRAVCDRCDCPLTLLERDRKPYIERRKRCAMCSDAAIASPCRVRGCIGVVSGNALFCVTCRDNKKQEVAAAWRAANAEKLRSIRRAYCVRHKDKVAAAHREYQRANRERCRAYNRASYARGKSDA